MWKPLPRPQREETGISMRPVGVSIIRCGDRSGLTYVSGCHVRPRPAGVPVLSEGSARRNCRDTANSIVTMNSRRDQRRGFVLAGSPVTDAA